MPQGLQIYNFLNQIILDTNTTPFLLRGYILLGIKGMDDTGEIVDDVFLEGNVYCFIINNYVPINFAGVGQVVGKAFTFTYTVQGNKMRWNVVANKSPYADNNAPSAFCTVLYGVG